MGMLSCSWQLVCGGEDTDKLAVNFFELEGLDGCTFTLDAVVWGCADKFTKDEFDFMVGFEFGDWLIDWLPPSKIDEAITFLLGDYDACYNWDWTLVIWLNWIDETLCSHFS